MPFTNQHDNNEKDFESSWSRRLPWHPAGWLLLVAVFVLAGDIHQGKLRLDDSFLRDDRVADADHYVELTRHPSFSRAALSDGRTIGYPLFLKLVQTCGSPDLVWLPYWHFAASVLAVFALFQGLRRFGLSTFWANGMSAAVLINVSALDFHASVLTDSLGISAAIAAVGLLLWVISSHTETSRFKQLALWSALGMTVMATYQIRPIYQTMALLIPLLGVFLLPVVTGRNEFWHRCWKVGPGLATMTLAPLLAFCCLRLLLVGDFGLVSFGGFALSGTSVQFLTPEMVPRMPAEMQPLAQEILDLRASKKINTRMGKEPWSSPIRNGKIDIKQFNVFFSPAAWNIASPAVKTIHGEDWVRSNQALTRFSLFVLQERRHLLPGYYRLQARRIYHYAYSAYKRSPERRLVRSLLFGSCLIFCFRATRRFRKNPRAWRSILAARFSWNSLRFVYAGLLISGAFLAANSLLILLTQAPLDRTVSPGVVFWPLLPLALAAWFAHSGEVQRQIEEPQTESLEKTLAWGKAA